MDKTSQHFAEEDTRDITPEARRTTLIALLIVFLLSALDQTIVSTAMPRIVADLNGLDIYAWVTTAYLLTSTVMIPIWGKFGDMWGRKLILILGICIFVAGSWLCGLSGEFGDLPLLGGGMTQLIVFRALQGIGGGALFTSAFATIADIFPPRDRAKYAGMLGAVFGLASVVGPIVGGWFTDHGSIEIAGTHIAGWRWVFYINLPTSLLALYMISQRMPDLGIRTGGKPDIPGALLIITALGSLMLALTFGPKYGWSSASVLGLSTLAFASLCAFLWVQSVVSNPILPLGLFRIPAFTTPMVASFIISMSFMGTIIYVPLYLQMVIGIKATNSGLTMLPLMGGLMVGAMLSGRLVTQTGKYKSILIAGCLILIAGLFFMSQLTPDSSTTDVIWRLLLIGFGLGPSQSLFTIISQSATPLDKIGVSTSTGMFLRQTGGLVGVSIFGALMTHELSSMLSKRFPMAGKFDLGALEAKFMNPDNRAAGIEMPPELKSAFAEAMSFIFTGAIVIVAIALVVVIFIPVIPLRGRGPHTTVEDVEKAVEESSPAGPVTP